MARSTETNEEFVARITQELTRSRFGFYPIAGGAEGDGGDGGGDGGDGGEEEVLDDPAKLLQQENARLKREQAEAAKAKRKAEADAKRAADAAKAEQGQYKTLAEERQTEIESLTARIAEMEAAAAEKEHRTSIEKAAENHGFKRPYRVYAILQDELGDQFQSTMEDPTLLNEALRKLAREEPELVDQQRRSGLPGSGQQRSSGSKDASQQHRELVSSLFNTPQL